MKERNKEGEKLKEINIKNFFNKSILIYEVKNNNVWRKEVGLEGEKEIRNADHFQFILYVVNFILL